jgi:hypothetical protein
MSDILSAIETALAKTSATTNAPTSERLIRDLENHFAVADVFKGFNQVPAELGKPDWHDLTKPSTRAALLHGVKMLADDKLARLKELATEYAATVAEQIRFSPLAAQQDHIAQRGNLHDLACDRSASIPSGAFRPRESFQDEYREKRTALNKRLELIVKEAFPLCSDVILTVEAELKTTVRTLEESERELAAAYDMKWEPSQIWKAAAVNLMVARKNIRLFMGRADQGPAQLLEGFVNLS